MPTPVTPTLNEDVILGILERLSRDDITSCSRLGRVWLGATRVVLYRRVHLNTSTIAAPALSRSLSSSEALRSYVRHLVVSHTFPMVDGLLDWIRMLPAHSLLSVHLERMPVGVTEQTRSFSVLDAPAVRTAPHVVIGQPNFLYDELSRLSTVLSYPCLDSFTLMVPRSLPLDLSCPLRLRRLSIGVFTEPKPQLVATLLTANTVPLERLDLLLPSLNVDEAVWLTECLTPHLSSLKHLALRTIAQHPHPIIDDLIPSLTSIQELACGPRTYTSALFAHLPMGLRSLTLESRDHNPFDVEELLRAIRRLALSGRRGGLEALTIGRHPSYLHYRYYDVVIKACETLGINFAMRRTGLDGYFGGRP